MKPTRRKRIQAVAIVWVASAIAALGAYMIVLSPQQKTCTKLERALEKKRQAYDEALAAASPENLRRQQDRLVNLRGQLGLFAVEEAKSASLTFDISTLARDNELGAFNVSSNPNRKEAMPDAPTLEQSYIDVEFEGSFLQFARFLNALERNRPVLFIDSFSLEKSRDGLTANKISMDLAALTRKVEKDS